MCCFAQSVESVSDTHIFARSMDATHQALVYGMKVSTAVANAMILPIPVAKGSGEGAVKFISLEKYPSFFEDLDDCFPQPKALGSRSSKAVYDAGPLKVVQVGSFDASFVPTIKDFGRLNAKFRLPNGVWERLGQYQDFGFAVFKLRKGSATIHPMAFTFPTAMPGKLFFPTVHIHDGEVHREADFDHSLYSQQSPRGLGASMKWKESEFIASAKVDLEKPQGLVLPRAHIYRRTMQGKLRNEDVIAAV